MRVKYKKLEYIIQQFHNSLYFQIISQDLELYEEQLFEPPENDCEKFIPIFSRDCPQITKNALFLRGSDEEDNYLICNYWSNFDNMLKRIIASIDMLMKQIGDNDPPEVSV